MNKHIIGLMRAVKAYGKLTVHAALSEDEDAALAALLTHPLIGDYERPALPWLKCWRQTDSI